MIPRVLEPEVMDTADEANDYDGMDHSGVNRAFVDDLLTAAETSTSLTTPGTTCQVLDVGTGTALIPIELAGRGNDIQITGIDLAEEMLILGRRNVAQANLTNIALQRVDAKALPFADGTFAVVMSNSIVHHIPQPRGTLAEMHRVLRTGGLLFVRDLLRPESETDVENLVSLYAGDESSRQQQLFRQSLQASLTLDELEEMLVGIGIDGTSLSQTSDRHWTLCWRRP